ncbi:MAG: MBL fold metallo-hydrolase [Verrucomicrobiae bacterium]|nr:MBL fold metallo-hydrolase [Verrucomicrobiae bacterium]
MLQLAVLGSGSSGNSALVCHGDTRILVDAGLSARQLSQRLEGLGVDPDSLTAIVLTHEHGDHTRGIEVFCRKRSLPVYATIHTSAIVRESAGPSVSWRQFEAGNSFRIEGVEIHSFPVPHDAVDPVGYLFDCGESRLGVLSDVGHVTRLILDRLQGVDTLFAEANYDDVLLMNDTKRPWSTKQRISNRHGHLSNEQTAELVCSIAGPNLHRVVLGHLSSDCNQPELAAGIIAKRLAAGGFPNVEVECACRHVATPLRPVARAAAPAPTIPICEEIPADSARVCEPSAAASPAPPSSEWRQSEWAF